MYVFRSCFQPWPLNMLQTEIIHVIQLHPGISYWSDLQIFSKSTTNNGLLEILC